MALTFLKNKSLFIVSILFLILSSLYILRGIFVVALVNNQPIFRFAFDRNLEKKYGRKTLDNQIAEMLILQEAERKKITITSEEIENRIAEIEKELKDQGQDNLESFLAIQGVGRGDFERQVNIQLIIEKLMGDQVKISDEEIKDYFENNKDDFPSGTTLEVEKEGIQRFLLQQKSAEKFRTWLEDLQKKATIHRFVNF